jgi:hypothetical protein
LRDCLIEEEELNNGKRSARKIRMECEMKIAVLKRRTDLAERESRKREK